MTPPSNDKPYRVPAPGEAAQPLNTPTELERLTVRRNAAVKTESRAKVNRERWRVLNTFTDTALSQAGAAAGAVWLVLFRFARSDGTVYASLSVLQEKTGLARKTIQRAVARLVELGEVKMLQRGGGAVATKYRLRRGGQKGP